MPIPKEEIDEILKKYGKKLRKQVNQEAVEYKPNSEFSKEYIRFKGEFLDKRLSWYENSSRSAYKLLKVKADKKNYAVLEKNIKMSHLDMTPDDAASFAMLTAIVLIGAALLFGIVSYFLTQNILLALVSAPLILIFFMFLNPLSNLPIFIGNNYRLKAANQMVLFVLYMVIYMRHTANMEHALKFAADHIGPPLSLDIRKVFWDVETNKYSTLKESLDSYLITWRDFNLDFINSVHLLESSLYESHEERRLILLDKSLENVLNASYDKMLTYAHGLTSPITMIHMLGVILPLLGLVILPLVTSFLSNIAVGTKITALILIYNILIPLVVFFVGMYVLNKRSTGYGETELKFKLEKHNFYPVFIILLFALIGLSPLLIHFMLPEFDIAIAGLGNLLDYYGELGPFGAGSVVLGLAVPLGFGLGIGLKNKLAVRKAAKKRDELKKLELEFSGSLFQLGNRIGEGIPSEKAFGKVSEVLGGTPTGKFFGRINYNIRNLGLGMEEAIFDPEKGAIKDYPSPLIESSMEVLVQGAKKSPEIVSQSLISMSNYSRSVHKVNERLKDLLAEILSSMKSQVSFLAPVIAGIVVGIATMIVTIMGSLKALVEQVGTGDEFATYAQLADFFNVTAAIPSYYFQLIVGFYILEIILVLSIMVNNLEFGFDKVNEKRMIGNNLTRGMLLYTFVAALVTILFTLLANVVLGGLTGYSL